MIVTHHFDKYNNLSFKFKFDTDDGVIFEYELSESYLEKADFWTNWIEYLKKEKVFKLDSGDVQSWNVNLSIRMPQKAKELLIVEIEKARLDPRINTIVDENTIDNNTTDDD